MARTKGTLALSANFEPQIAAPLDARYICSKKDDLILSTTWTAKDGTIYAYQGMITSVWNDGDNNGVYQLNGTDYTIATNWVKVGEQDLSGLQPKTDTSLETDSITIVGAINEVNSIAKGATKAMAFNDYQAVIVQMSVAKLNVGQNIYVGTLNVPDLWIKTVESTNVPYTYVSDAQFVSDILADVQIGYYKLSILETQKVDLSGFATITSVTAGLDTKVDKVTGKGLSTNDYTTDEKNKLAGIDIGAQVNVIERITVGGVAQTITDKTVDLTIPNPDLTNYYTKDEINTNFRNETQATIGALIETTELTTILDTTKIAASENSFLKWFSGLRIYTYLKSKFDSVYQPQLNGTGFVKVDGTTISYDNSTYLTGTKVDSFNTRTGAVTLTSNDVTDALTYTPINKAGDTGIGNLSMGALSATTGTFSGLLTANSGLTVNVNNGTTNALIVLNNGNVGIGTTSPSTALDLGGGSAYINTNTVYQIFAPTDKVLQIKHTAQSVLSLVSDANTDGAVLGGIYFGRTGGQTDAHINLGGVRGIYRAANSGLDLAFLINGGSVTNEAMRILSNGNIGINTTTPGCKLDVNGEIRSSQTGKGFYVSLGTNGGFPAILTDGNSAIRVMDRLEVWGRSGARYFSVKDDNSNTNFFLNGQGNSYFAATNGNVGIGTTSPTSQLTQKSTSALESASLGNQLLSSGDAWTVPSDWSGNFTSGFTHTSGATAGVITDTTLTPSANSLYQISFTVANRTTGSFTISFGNVTSGSYSGTNAWGVKTIGTGTLSITPTNDFNGTIVIGIQQITGTYSPIYTVQDSTGNNTIEIRSSLTSLNNLFIGRNAGRYNTTGFSNTFIGFNSGISNTTGSYNTANGVNAFQYNTTGSYNTANGMYSLYSNTTGNNNTANGMQALYYNTTGSYNTANGMYTLLYNTIGYNNVANGYASLFSNTTGNYNTADGISSLYSNTTGGSNTANGSYSLYSNTTGYSNTALGYQSGRYIADGTTANATSNNSLYLGYNTKALANGDTNEIVIGYNATGLGSNTVVLGNSSIVTTALYGRVGIGTTAPRTTLEVNGSAWFKTHSIDDAETLIIEANTSVNAVQLRTYTANGNIVLGNNSNNVFLATGSGNVGIGTTSPAYTLDVNGTFRNTNNSFIGPIVPGYPYSSSLTWQSDNSGYYYGFGYQKNDGTNKKLQMWWIDYTLETNINSVLNVAIPGHTFDGTAPNSGRTIGASITASGISYFNGGNVGIGTTNPAVKLDVSGTTGEIARFASAAAEADSNFISLGNTRAQFGYNGTTSNAVVQGGSGKGIEFNVNNSFGLGTAMVINPSGNVGIGTKTPSQLLSVGSNNQFTVDSNGNITVTSITSNTTSFNLLNDTATTINAFGAATVLNIGVLNGITTIKSNLIVNGNLTINGTTETINSTTVNVADKNIVLGYTTTPTDTTADGGGIILDGTTNKTFNWLSATGAWTSSENMDLASGKTYKLGTYDVLSFNNPNLTVGGANGIIINTSNKTITQGIWNGTPIDVAYGGTGYTSGVITRKVTGLITGGTTSFSVNHGFTNGVIAQVFTTNGGVVVDCDIETATAGTTTFYFNVAPTSGTYSYIIVG